MNSKMKEAESRPSDALEAPLAGKLRRSSRLSRADSPSKSKSTPSQSHRAESRPSDALEAALAGKLRKSSRLSRADSPSKSKSTLPQSYRADPPSTAISNQKKEKVRKKDQFWEYAEKFNFRFKCMFCQCDFVGGASKIKAHLAGVPRKGIIACTVVPASVQEKALLAIGGRNKELETASNSSNSKESELISPSMSSVTVV